MHIQIFSHLTLTIRQLFQPTKNVSIFLGFLCGFLLSFWSPREGERHGGRGTPFGFNMKISGIQQFWGKEFSPIRTKFPSKQQFYGANVPFVCVDEDVFCPACEKNEALDLTRKTHLVQTMATELKSKVSLAYKQPTMVTQVRMESMKGDSNILPRTQILVSKYRSLL